MLLDSNLDPYREVRRKPVTKLPSTVEHVRLVLGESDFARCVAAGADMEPADAARYARQQIAILCGQPNTSAPAPS
jgi:hypothetical protein